MNCNSTTREAGLVRRDEKMANGLRLLGYYTDRASVRLDADLAERTVSFVLRSPSSPMAKVLLRSVAELADLDIVVNGLFTRVDPAEDYAAFAELAAARGKPLVSVRWLKREAFADANEQLVLGAHFAWYGDCMRREPENRDAYEVMHLADRAAAAQAASAFKALWSASVPAPAGVLSTRDRLESQVGGPLDLSGYGVIDPDLPPLPSAGTRH